jgi:uncharacterized protein YcfJ
MRTTTTMAALALGALTLTACGNGPSEEEQRARDLQMAMNGYPNQLVSPSEIGQLPQPGVPGYGAPQVPVAYVQTPQGLVPVYSQQMPSQAYPAQSYPAPAYPAPAPIYQQQPMVMQASAPAPVRSAPTAARTATRAPQKVTNVKRDAAIGAAVGTIAGGVIGKDVKGALIGAAAGGLLGAVVGATVDVQHR